MHMCKDTAQSDLIYSLIKRSRCHDQVPNCLYHYVLAHSDNVLVSYLSFRIITVGKTKALEMSFSCSHLDYRRKGLSKLLRACAIIVAKRASCKYVISDANELSGPMLRDTFGFEFNAGEDGTGEYIETVADELNWESSPTAVLLLESFDVESLLKSCLVK